MSMIIKLFIPFMSVIFMALLTFALAELGGMNSSLESTLPLWYGLTVTALYLFLKRKYKSWFPNAAKTSWKMPPFKTIIGLILLTPLLQSLLQWTIILYNCIESFGSASESISEILEISAVSVLFAPILEELIFRYAGMSPFASTKGKIYALLSTSLLFGMLHMQSVDNFLRTTFLGLIFGLIFLKYKNIWHPIIFHFGCNLWVSVAYIMIKLNLPGIACNELHSVVYINSVWMLVNLAMAIAGIIILMKLPKLRARSLNHKSLLKK